MTFVAAIQAYATALPPAAGGLAHLRPGALQAFAQQGLPGKRHEDWKYTSVGFLEQRRVGERANGIDSGAAFDDVIAPFCIEGAHVVLFVAGQFIAREAEPPTGVSIRDLATGGGKFKAGSIASAEYAPFVALNASTALSGAVIEVDEGVHVETPIQILVLPGQAPASMAAPRHLIHLAAGARATVIETLLCIDDVDDLLFSVTEAKLEKDAELEHIVWSRGSTKRSARFNTLAVEQARQSTLRSTTFWLGGKLNRQDLTVTFSEPEATAHVDGLYICNDAMHVDNHTAVDHVVPHCTSRQLYKGVLGGQSRGVFNGKVFFREGAHGSDTDQANHNLLLSDDAEVDTKPQLEIFIDDVKAAHGSTVGQLDDEAVFYLRSRGIGKGDAEALLTEAFVAEVVERVPEGPVRKAIAKDVGAALAVLVAARQEEVAS